jgi:hypothetical protein
MVLDKRRERLRYRADSQEGIHGSAGENACGEVKSIMKHVTKDLPGLTWPSDLPTNIRSIVFVRYGLPSSIPSNTVRGREAGDFEQTLTVTDLMDNSQYRVERIESGYRILFPFGEGQVVVELDSEVDLPTVAHDLARRFAGSEPHAL